MQSFFEWFENGSQQVNRPWLILGKGPSFSKRNQFDISQYYTLSLNHAVREQPVTVAHMIDYDVVDACGDAILQNAEFLLLPWVPHVKNDPGPYDLAALTTMSPILRKLNSEGRLLWYNLSSAGKKRRNGDSPVVRARFFSAEAALNLLARAGVKRVRSLGVDGGASYSSEFDDLKDKTLLANTRISFDEQFGEIARTILETGIDYAPLDVESPIRVYVGATEAQMLAVKVLEYSIRKHASMSVEVLPLHLSGIDFPEPTDSKNRARTPFTLQRFLIPQIAGYHGKAIYLDSDMQVFQDIRYLWTMPLNGADLLTAREPGETGRQPQFSVMLLNCESLKWDIKEIVRALDENKLTYEQLVYDMSVAKEIRADIDPSWNSLERFETGKTALLHYTDMSRQPWVSRNNPFAHVWVSDLLEALDRGIISLDYVKEHVKKGYLRPSLVYQLANRAFDPRHLPAWATFLDKDYIPPFKNQRIASDSIWAEAVKALQRRMLRHYEARAVSRLVKKRRKR